MCIMLLGLRLIYCNIVCCNTVSKAIYCLTDLCSLCLQSNICPLLPVSVDIVTLEWKILMAEDRLQNYRLAVRDLNVTQNELQPQVFACKLLIKNSYSVFEN